MHERLLDQVTLESEFSLLQDWEQEAYEHFKQKITDKKNRFPCIPATQGFALNQLNYGFILWSDHVDEVFSLVLKEYINHAKEYGKYTSLIIFIEGIHEKANSIATEDFFYLFWDLLNRLKEHDEKPWPDPIPKEPEEALWQFCFHGEPLFMYCATPSHEKRKSRHFPYFMLAITPRWVFEEFRKDSKHAHQIQKKIHERLQAYDAVDIHPDLKEYGDKDNFEWKQYFLRDDETSPLSCPFSSYSKH
ncbi:FPC/CPF motif-containing protein YcgG [Pullulanibacillus pueri]|uniref:YqcI/YcgG family protein n=1 Tax=Pullulanibacillus pueri TaxID=1437324 RepID=A0A8J2ZSC9_9BACL|nr:YqcI/YcgG family protein [Pullulanibacillus pueri]MBM7680454.1 FPC/CPF motif-containing protein YcgG [Pullulanibacillus pueri]GGH75008.1 hypothetical protein GCM10007096_03780 [Pullulanibacillus pueri]